MSVKKKLVCTQYDVLLGFSQGPFSSSEKERRITETSRCSRTVTIQKNYYELAE